MLLTLKTPYHDGTTHLVLQPDELIQRLVALVPRPHKNLLVYHGVLAPNSRWRERVVQYGRSDDAAAAEPAPIKGARPNADWAHLMRRAFDLDVLQCPRCAGRMRILALIQDPHAAHRILRHLGMRAHAPPAAPARIPDSDFHVA